MYSFKSFTYILVAAFIAFKAYKIATEFSGNRVIEVREEMQKDSTPPLKGFKADGIPVVRFKSTVTPVTFWDKLLLTNGHSCLLSEIVEIIAGLAIVWFVIRLNYNNVFSQRSVNNFILVLVLIIAVLGAYDFGYGHTRDYVCDALSKKNGRDYWFDRFKLYPRRTNSFYQLHLMIPFYWIIGLYRVFVDHQTEKSEAVEQ
ncbi:hypothetical protein JN11_02605 [Mucilaginibacter frigoritolerans]|uniref:Uncharacterized protein n=1 Tax=Mucilaginibacter frigoritolerans TaxID=652788 RepID=A0A562U198_9SPHI|nr:hypothetical protein [Mucilaginibacter frigoritolerans]TWI99288.1 hypothetical protein JN11_02605 [Mucilaginibacter frigoritolerans]